MSNDQGSMGPVRHKITYNKLTAEQKKGLTASDVDRLSWVPRRDDPPPEVARDLKTYEWTTSAELREKGRRPLHTKMLMRDFIEDSLYNPIYGYFSSQATIFNSGKPFEFNTIRSELAFQDQLGERYTEFEDALDSVQQNEARQLWHTPTELFRPHYAEAMARYIVENYRITSYPYDDLIIYELGAGNGTFMLNVLDYIRETSPDVYMRTKYKIVEISSTLAELQERSLARAVSSEGHSDRVEIINKSFLDWDTYVPSACFVVCLEVIDNFGHDLIRWERKTKQPEQAAVLIDEDGDMYTTWHKQIDPLAARYIRAREAACDFQFPHPLSKRAKGIFPRKHSRMYTEHEYIPTRLLQFFSVLQNYFPAHRLLLSDFHKLPDASAPRTLNAPVVQTRYQRRTIPVSTPLVRQGYFDIFFPTDFRVMEALYRAVTGKLTRAMSHEEFMVRWADVAACMCQDGEIPLLSWYKNAAVMVTD
ncbi:MAG: hypothetical protein Q9159_000599 [Coniocarpon cinnabarinum]